MKAMKFLCAGVIASAALTSAYTAVHADQDSSTAVTDTGAETENTVEQILSMHSEEEISAAQEYADEKWTNMDDEEYLLVDPNGGYYSSIYDIRTDKEMIGQVCRNGEEPEFITVAEAKQRDMIEYLELE